MRQPDRDIMCATCFRTLDVRMSPFGVARIHTIQDPDDHLAIPVEIDERWLGRCDFCNEASPSFRLPARDFRLPDDPGAGSSGDWAACAACAQLIERGDWGALIDRVTAAYVRRRGGISDGQVRRIHKTYRRLRANISGPVRPL